ncbi:pyridoxamine 5'-phosphate oxidase family protein [Kineococcus auxinigenes]|uniref:pyridoxamine 5'-phosphate oxidase family protein n=1 Tax=unclassified Kineococcus TaxID=2621656 RepID=UPI003D7EC544
MADTKDGPELHPTTREPANGHDFAAISTPLPSGRIQTQCIWAGVDGDRLYVNTEDHRQEFHDLERDALVTIAIRDEQNPYRYAEVRGTVGDVERGQAARDRIDELSQEHEGGPHPPDQIKTERVTVFVVPERQPIAD